MLSVQALAFDVFGTLVDWRTSVSAAGRAVGARLGIQADWERVADAWRDRYQPGMEPIRSGRRPWTTLDVLHRESLDEVLAASGLQMPEEARSELVDAWHHLRPWPDVVPGLERLRRRYVTATLSNGHVRLLVDLARHAEMRFDAILSAQNAGTYKPMTEVYLTAARLLDVAPSELMMVAAHPADLEAAASAGLRTAYVRRPLERGAGRTTEPPPSGVDVVAEDLLDLAIELGI